MLLNKNVGKSILVIIGIIIFYSQTVIWQSYIFNESGRNIKLNFMDPEYHLKRGMDYASEEEFSKAVKLGPANPSVYYKMANYYISVSSGADLSKAHEAYKNAILYSLPGQQSKILEEIYTKITQGPGRLKEFMPDTDAAKHLYAGFLKDKKLYGEAASEYKHLVQVASDNYILADSYNWLAIICLWQGRFDEAIEDFNKSLSIVKDDKYKSWIFRSMGDTYLNKGDFHNAKNLYRQAIKADPAYWANYYGMANVCQKMGLKKEAVDYYSKALQRNPAGYKPEILKRLDQLGQ